MPELPGTLHLLKRVVMVSMLRAKAPLPHPLLTRVVALPALLALALEKKALLRRFSLPAQAQTLPQLKILSRQSQLVTLVDSVPRCSHPLLAPEGSSVVAMQLLSKKD